jgi:hypothetical protein
MKNYLLLSILILVFSCKKDKKEETEPEPEILATCFVNGAYFTFTAAELQILQREGELVNYISFVRQSNNTRIILRFPGTSEGSFSTLLQDTIPSAEFVDASGRRYIADEGLITINEYSMKNGRFSVTGGFEFKSESYDLRVISPTEIDTIWYRAIVTEGGFANVQNAE